VPSRRLEDKIRQVCSLAKVVKSDDAWLILSELRALLHQHVQHLRLVAAGKLSGKSECFERRSHESPPKNYLSNSSARISADTTPFPDQGSVHGRTDQRASDSDFDFDSPRSIGQKAET
jgi:hypothetical protein